MQADDGRPPHEGPLFRSIVRNVKEIITVVDADGVVRFVNDAGGGTVGDPPDESTGQEALSWVHPDDRALTLERRAWLRAEPGRTTVTVLRVRAPDGSWRHVETHGINLLDDPDVRGLLYVTRDVEDRARSEMTLVHSLVAQRVVAELGLRALRAGDVGEVLSDGLERVVGLLGTPYSCLLLPDETGRLRVRLDVGPDPLPQGHPWPDGGSAAGAAYAEGHPVITDDLTADPRWRRLEEHTGRGILSSLDVPLRDGDRTLGVLSAHSCAPRVFSPVDVSALTGVADVLAGALVREERERTAVDQALHCPLTGLPTRPLFLDRLDHALERARRGGDHVAVLVVDLDRFKQVNDAWGHAAGDEVLRVLGPRLQASARAADTVARYGGDEFVVLCDHDVTAEGVSRVCERIRRACYEPVELPSGEVVMLSGSIGVAWSAEVGTDPVVLLAAADAAMYRDKAAPAC